MKPFLLSLLKESVPLRQVNDMLFFYETPTDVVTPKRAAPLDQRHWSLLRQAHHQFYQQTLLTEDPQAVVLDVGAGERQFRQFFTRFEQYVAMDFVPYPDIDIVVNLTETWPIKEAAIDLLVASNVFEHLPDTNLVLKECARVLKPGGKMLVAVPFLLGVHQAPYDFVRHTHFSWQRLLNEAGFEIESMEASGTIADVVLHLSGKLFPILSDTDPFSSTFANRIWSVASKIAHRLLKAYWALLRSCFFRFAPKKLEFCLGYQFVARRRTS